MTSRNGESFPAILRRVADDRRSMAEQHAYHALEKVAETMYLQFGLRMVIISARQTMDGNAVVQW